jgi:membrane peptidoglycan carboxypeptidase
LSRPAAPITDSNRASNPSGRMAGPRRGARVRGRRLALRAVLVLVALVAILVAAGLVYLALLPSVGDAEHRVDRILALHHGTAGGPQPPAKLGAAVVSVEDEHFYSNFLVNVIDGAGRAALATLHTDQDPGGSTIDQQLAKQLYPHGSGLFGTLKEIGLGVKLALDYPKPQILAMYLNAVYYGQGYWGDVAAARGYFGVSPDDLDWAQAAMLAGLPQAPSAYDPVAHLALAKRRQRHVLDQLVVNHHLTAAQANAAYAEPLGLR